MNSEDVRMYLHQIRQACTEIEEILQDYDEESDEIIGVLYEEALINDEPWTRRDPRPESEGP